MYIFSSSLNHDNSFLCCLFFVLLIEEIVCVWVDVPTNVDSYPPFEKVSTFFGIWHEFKRDNHRGLHEFYFQSNYVLLINIFNPQVHQHGDSYTYKHLKPNNVEPIAREEFNMDLLLNMPPEDLKSNVVKAKALNMNCDEVRNEMKSM